MTVVLRGRWADGQTGRGGGAALFQWRDKNCPCICGARRVERAEAERRGGSIVGSLGGAKEGRQSGRTGGEHHPLVQYWGGRMREAVTEGRHGDQDEKHQHEGT